MPGLCYLLVLGQYSEKQNHVPIMSSASPTTSNAAEKRNSRWIKPKFIYSGMTARAVSAKNFKRRKSRGKEVQSAIESGVPLRSTEFIGGHIPSLLTRYSAT